MGTLHVTVAMILCVIPANAMMGASVLKGQRHSLPANLKLVFLLDKVVGEGLQHLCSTNERGRRYVDSYKRLVKDAAAFNIDTVSPVFTGNILHSYSAIKRLVVYWPKAKEDMFVQTELKEHIDRIKEAEERFGLPSIEDLEGAAFKMVTLQHVYDLSIPHLVTGRILNNFTSIELDDWDCLYMANIALKNGRYAPSWQWYNHVRSTTKDIGMEDHVVDLLKTLIKKHDESWENNDNYFAFPLSQKPIQTVRRSDVTQGCRGDYQAMPDMKCRLTTKGSPYFFLQPVKEETIATDPDINLYYDILSETEMEDLKSLSEDKLVEDRKHQNKTWYALISSPAHPVITTLYQRVSYLTGLSTYDTPGGAEEMIKVRNYGVGGYLTPHVDVRCKHLGDCPHPNEVETYPISGERISTTVFYLNEVEAGGRTVFYDKGVSVGPVKGAVLLWYNLLKNGEYDRRVDHAACPVLLGSKWVAIKWVRENENFLRRPCSLNPEE